MLRIVSHEKTESFLQHPAVQQLLYSNNSYDLVFTGGFFNEEATLVFGHKFKAPVIALLPMNTWSATDFITGNPVSLAFAPEYFAFPFTDKMSFMERVQNALSGTVCLLAHHWQDLPGHDAILQRQASMLSPPPPPVHQMATDVSLTFINVHPLVSYPKPFPPNIILIGGIHIEPDPTPLTQVMIILFLN